MLTMNGKETSKKNNNKKKNKSKDDKDNDNQQPPVVPDGWTRCHAYLPRKHRFCRQLTLENSKFCGNHQEIIFASNSNTNQSKEKQQQQQQNGSKGGVRRRIPCPLDPSHTIYEDMLSRHLKICPKARQQRDVENQPFYRYNINGGGYGGSSIFTSADATATSSSSSSSLELAKTLALRVLQVHQRLFVAKNYNTLEEIKSISLKEIEDALPLRDLSPPLLQEENLAESIESYHIKSGGPKHLQQQASLLGHLKNKTSSLYCTPTINSTTPPDSTTPPQPPPPVTILELGAGRGMLGLLAAGYFAAGAGSTTNSSDISATNNNDANSNTTTTTTTNNTNNVSLIMIERAGTRSKADTILRNHNSKLLLQQQNTTAGVNGEQQQPQPPPSARCCLQIEKVRNHWKRIQCDLAHVHMPTVISLKSQNAQGEQNNHQDKQKQQKTNHQSSTAPAITTTTTNKESTARSNDDAPTPPTTTTPPHNNNNNNNNSPNNNILAIAKHLCGAGTDLALKSLYPIRKQLKVCMMATCCHGVCTWEHYVGRQYLANVLVLQKEQQDGDGDDRVEQQDDTGIIPLKQFGPNEFELLRLWSSGTVKAVASTATTKSTTSAAFDNSNTNAITIIGDDDDADAKTTTSATTATKTATEATTTTNEASTTMVSPIHKKQRTTTTTSPAGKEEEEEEKHYNNPSSNNNVKGIVSVTAVVEALELQCGVQGLGRACQRLLDYGRQQYMQNVLFAEHDVDEDGMDGCGGSSASGTDEKTTTVSGGGGSDERTSTSTTSTATVELCYYVPSSVTPQNAVLMASRRRKR